MNKPSLQTSSHVLEYPYQRNLSDENPIRATSQFPHATVVHYDEVLAYWAFPLTFATFCYGLRATGLHDYLQSGKPITLFVATDLALKRRHKRGIFDWLRDIPLLKRYLSSYLVPLKLTKSDLNALAMPQRWASHTFVPLELPTLAGPGLEVSWTVNNALQVGGVGLLQSDIDAENIAIHILDGALALPQLQESVE